eukprot:13104151-Heterocapsa_arctica.AAC.1
MPSSKSASSSAWPMLGMFGTYRLTALASSSVVIMNCAKTTLGHFSPNSWAVEVRLAPARTQ